MKTSYSFSNKLEFIRKFIEVSITSCHDEKLESFISIYSKALEVKKFNNGSLALQQDEQKEIASFRSYMETYIERNLLESHLRKLCPTFDKNDNINYIFENMDFFDSKNGHKEILSKLQNNYDIDSEVEKALNIYIKQMGNFNNTRNNKKSNLDDTLISNLLLESEKLEYKTSFFMDELKFIYGLVAISSYVKSLNLGKDMETKTKIVTLCLRDFNSTLNKNLYLPLIHSKGSYHRVLRIAFKECKALNSRERVPIMLFFEVTKDDEIDEMEQSDTHFTEIIGSPVNGQVVKKAGKIKIHEDWQSPRTRKSNSEINNQLDSIFGESWEAKKERIRNKSPIGKKISNWDLISIIVKSGDDLRQEQLATILIKKFYDIFKSANLPLWLRPFEVMAVSSDAGFIETIPDTVSIDSLKGIKENLRQFFVETFGNKLRAAQEKFVESLAGYSLVCYILSIKDRHNGNILIDREGHIIHIDYGFMLSTSPGSLRFERAPFKLTNEYIEVMGGKRENNSIYMKFCELIELGFLAVRERADEIISIVEIMKKGSNMPCLEKPETVKELRDRFQLHLNEKKAREYARKLIKTSLYSLSTESYDGFQLITNKIK